MDEHSEAADRLAEFRPRLARTEWGVRHEWDVTACESEQAARQLQADEGGALVYRQTWQMTWPDQAVRRVRGSGSGQGAP